MFSGCAGCAAIGWMTLALAFLQSNMIKSPITAAAKIEKTMAMMYSVLKG